MSKSRFLQALQDVGADESKWRFYRNRIAFESRCLAGHLFSIDVYDCGIVELDPHQDIGNDGDGDDAYLCLREADDNLVEAVRFAENLRRALAGEPPLPTPMAGHALSERQPPRPGHYLIKERPEYPWAYAWVSEHIDGTMLACLPAHGEVKYTHWAGPILEPEEVPA